MLMRAWQDIRPAFFANDMLSEFEKKIAAFAESQDVFDSASKVLLAVSGGPDSTALLHAVAALKADGALAVDILCAHINHHVRGSEDQADEDFVVSQATKLNLPLLVRQLDVPGYGREHKLSIETAGRKLRIDALIEIAARSGCNLIATAHHKNDNAETLLQRLARGTGYRGLAGIWPRRNFGCVDFIRPLLCVTRDQIAEYLKQRRLNWRVDHTNYDCSYRRNFIRHRLIPALQQDCSGSIVERLSQLAEAGRMFYASLCRRAEKVWPTLADCNSDEVTLDDEALVAEPPIVQVELIRRSLVAIGSGERDLTQAHYESILQLAADKASGKTVTLPNGFRARREYGSLIFARQDMARSRRQSSTSIEAEIPGQTRFGDYLIETAVLDAATGEGKFETGKMSFVEWFDLDELRLPLEVRFRQLGERFVPLGLMKEKKVGKFLTAQRVPQQIRNRTLIVADREKVIWVWPIRMSEQAKVTSQTRKILRLQITDAVMKRQIHLPGEEYERT
jgi:tRNA(Ile)-lysidine synthase